MKIKYIIILFLFSVFSSEAQDVKSLDFSKLEPRLHASNDTVYLINFWATWCKPCTEEIPDFVRVNKELAGRNFKMIFVSLDMPSSLDTRLKSFIKDYHMDAEVVLLDDPDFNSWINKVDRSWEGSIPATLIYYPGKRKFVEGSLDYEKIMKFVEPGLK
jgi:thiol-disulfide isomerase/thioredoxin